MVSIYSPLCSKQVDDCSQTDSTWNAVKFYLGSTPHDIIAPNSDYQWAVAGNTGERQNGAGWKVTIKECFGQAVDQKYTSVLDIGSPNVNVPTKYYNQYMEKLKAKLPAGVSVEHALSYEGLRNCACLPYYRKHNQCDKEDQAASLKNYFPDFELTLEGVDGKDVKLSIPMVHLDWDEFLYCHFKLRDSGKDPDDPGQYFFFGDSFIKGHVTTFDYENKRIGFAQPINKYAFGN